MDTVVDLLPEHRESVDRFLAASPGENAHLLHLLHAGAGELVGVRRGDDWVAVAGRSLYVSAYARASEDLSELATTIAAWLMLTPTLVARAELVDGLWETLELLPFPLRYDRRQDVYLLTREAPPLPEPPEGVRQARAEDVEAVAVLTAEMTREEILEDPLEIAPEAFRRAIAREVEEGRVTVVEADGEIKYLVRIAQISPHGSEVVGGYTPPRFRRQGWGQHGLSAGCRWGIQQTPRVVGFVFDYNDPSKHMLKKLGFVDTGIRMRYVSWDLNGF